MEGEYQGFLFAGSVAMFVGLFFVLLRGFKIITTLVSSVVAIVIVVFISQLIVVNVTEPARPVMYKLEKPDREIMSEEALQDTVPLIEENEDQE